MYDALQIRKKLIKIARETERPSQEILQYYGMERFLYRLSVSDYHNRFILKGGLLFTAWSFNHFRVTQDIDLLGMTNNQPDNLARICEELCSIEAQDGIVFNPASVTTSTIRPGGEYQRVQVKFKASLGPSKLHMRVDIGFADAVYPQPTSFSFPTILESSTPQLLGYTQESVIAEKVDAMLQLGEVNSRMKDFYDVWYLAHRISFRMHNVSEALRATLAARKNEIPTKPHIFDPEFRRNQLKQNQWKNFCRQNRFQDIPDFIQLMTQLIVFIKPVLAEVIEQQNKDAEWLPELFQWKH